MDVFCENDLIQMWIMFGDIPIDDEDRILLPFIYWEAGTNRFEIWHWFDEKYSGGVHKLMEDCYEV